MKLEKFNYSSGKKSRWFLYGFIMCAVLMVLINLFLSQAKYLNTESIKLVEGNISYKPYDFKVMAMYQENDSGNYEVITSIPTNGYKISEEKSYCTLDNINKDSNAILKTIGNEHSIKNISPNDKCYLYFDKVVISNIEDIINSKTIARRTDFSTTITEDTTGTIFVAPDDDGDSFYFAGAVQDNWVKFAGFYWRIIRINGDGTLRMIYSGSEESGPATTGEATQIGTSAFNENYNDNAYVGYMYGTPGSSTYEETHANINDSTIKQYIDNWYENNLISYESNIDNNAGFCNDRSIFLGETWPNYGVLGYGSKYTAYSPLGRILFWENGKQYWKTTQIPIMNCINAQNDLFTRLDSNKGNKKLKYSIGLLTIDESIFAGLIGGKQNKKNYLYTGEYYWTLSPANVGNKAFMINVNSNGGFIGLNEGSNDVQILIGVRPVINLKADIQFSSGDGTTTNPYIVS